MTNDEPHRAVPSSGPASDRGASTLGADDDLGTPAHDGTPGSASARSGAAAPVRRELGRGETFGRYVVVSRLGQGGMSVVYVAYDSELDRKVALKLLLEQREDGPVARTRLLREAQALARLAHPNVVAVHDVGTVGGRVYLAMELVVGRTLDAWLAAAPRRWAEVLEAFVAAGKGLVAAHAAGLVHRDFKPANVMLGDDGRVRVMDFGLARANRADDHDDDVPAGVDVAEVLTAPLTRTGALLGTPRYMAPEQWRGETSDARTDQFAYCVSLWEALHGEPPFAGKTVGALAERVLHGEVHTAERAVVPTWLRRLVRRGLSVDPAQRWPSMEALLEALEGGRARQRARRRLVGLAAVGVAGLGVVAWGRYDDVRRAAGCERAGAQISEVWNDDAREALHQALLRTGVGTAESVFERTVPWIDEWTDGWSRARTQVCMEAEVEGTRAAEPYARALDCFDERRDELAGLLAALDESQRSALGQATQAAARLSRIDACVDPTALARRPVPADPSTRDRVVELRRELLRIQGQRIAGLFGTGLDAAEAVLEQAKELGYEPLTTRAWSVVGSQAQGAKQLDRAEAAFLQAYQEAGARGNDEGAASAAINLMSLFGVERERVSEGLAWAESAKMLVRRMGEDEGVYGAWLSERLAELYLAAGDEERTLVHAQRALDISDRVLGPEHPAASPVLVLLGRAHLGRGDAAAALPFLARALAIQESAMGPEHPSVGVYLTGLATVRTHLGELDEARVLLERSLAIQAAFYGPHDINVGIALNQLGNVLMARGDYAAALPLFERTSVIMEATLGADHPHRGRALLNIANAHGHLGQLERALALYDRAIVQLEGTLGPQHPEVGTAEGDAGQVLVQLGRLAEAVPRLERALAIAEQAEESGPAVEKLREALARAKAG